VTAQALSIAALWGATLLYAIALVSYSIHLARVTEAKGAKKSAPAAGRALGIARATTVVGALLHAAGVGARWVEAGHVPWSTMYEYTITGSFVAVVVFLVVGRFREVTFLGAGVTGIATLSLGLALPLLYGAAAALQPALQSYWLVIHVSIAVIATGVFSVAFVATALQLGRDYRDAATAAGASSPFRGRAFQLLDGVPTPVALEALAFRLNAFGFVLWTFTVTAGAIWAENAWGRFWGWDPKEVWSFIIWLIFAAYLHARTTQGWTGRKAAYLSIAGFAALIMNFTVVNLVVQGLHSYAGV